MLRQAKAWKFKLQGRIAKNILRLRELVTVISKQQVIVPEQKLRALLS